MIGQHQSTAQTIQQRLEKEALGVPALLKQADTKTIIDYFAHHLAEQYANIQLQKQNNYKNLLQRLFPEILGRALPAYALAQFSIKHPVEYIARNDHFQVEGTDLYFSPLVNSHLIGAKRCLVVSQQSTCHFKKEEREMFTGHCPFIEHPGGLMLGIRLHPNVKTINGLSLSIEGLPTDKIQFLPFVQMETVDDQLEFKLGFTEHSVSAPTFPDHEFFRIQSIRSKCLSELGKSVFTIQMQEEAELTLLKNNDPQFNAFLHQQFAIEDLEDLVWLSFHFPAPFTAMDLANCNIHLNSVPMWNVREDISTDQMATSNEIIVPLQSAAREDKEYFLGLQKVKTDTGPFVHAPIQNDLKHTYRIQERNIHQFGARAIQQYLQDLLFMIQREKDQLGQLRQEEFLLLRPLESLSTIIQQLEEQIKNYRGPLVLSFGI